MFQSLGRDSVGFSWAFSRYASREANMFQSLGRDSVGFSPVRGAGRFELTRRFQSLGRDSVGFSGSRMIGMVWFSQAVFGWIFGMAWFVSAFLSFIFGAYLGIFCHPIRFCERLLKWKSSRNGILCCGGSLAGFRWEKFGKTPVFWMRATPSVCFIASPLAQRRRKIFYRMMVFFSRGFSDPTVSTLDAQVTHRG